MRIENQFVPYIVQSSETLHHALTKLNANQSRILFVVSAFGELLGSLTDGDVRRWLTSSQEIDLSISVESVMNADCLSVGVGIDRVRLSELLTEKVLAIPLVDLSNRVTGIALKNREGFRIGDKLISDTSPSFLIAEIGNNHQGDIALARKMVDLAKEAGADCAKFQMRHLDDLYKDSQSDDLGAEYTKDLLAKYSLSKEHMLEIFDYCKDRGMEPLCTPWDLASLEVLEDYGMAVYKVASADFTNFQLLEALANTGRPLICSTGMATEAEIKQSVRFLNSKNATFTLLHCNSTYPTPFKDVNLAYMERLKKISGGFVGYSGHERGWGVPVAAVSLGAKIIEKHFTVDKSLEGNDHKVSLLPEEFSQMVQQIREVEESIGHAGERELTQGEMLNRENLAKSLVARVDISTGQEIKRSMLTIRSPGQGLQPNCMEKLVGRKAIRDIPEGGYFFESDLCDEVVGARDYSFNRPFGIPARYHDYLALTKESNLDFVEFHLSYKDMELSISDFFEGRQDIGFAVHCPELFSGDHILDLATSDLNYRSRSLLELERVVTVTNELKVFFPNTDSPVIVVNAGGFNSAGFVSEKEKAGMYARVGEALNSIDARGVTIAIQTMPPFPWHFGGQSYHNLFLCADEIVAFCKAYDAKICLDVSHTQMACNYYGWDLIEYVTKVAPYIVHMHVVDAKGSDGEGVEVGKGDVDFVKLAQTLDENCKGVQFIPEVWQGHKNNGEGFWAALAFLEEFF